MATNTAAEAQTTSTIADLPVSVCTLDYPTPQCLFHESGAQSYLQL